MTLQGFPTATESLGIDNNAASANNYIASNRYSGHNLNTCTNPYIITDCNWIGVL